MLPVSPSPPSSLDTPQSVSLNTPKWNCQTAPSNPEPVTHLPNILSIHEPSSRGSPEPISQRESPAANPPPVLPAPGVSPAGRSQPLAHPGAAPHPPIHYLQSASDENICSTGLNNSNPLILQVRPTGIWFKPWNKYENVNGLASLKPVSSCG